MVREAGEEDTKIIPDKIKTLVIYLFHYSTNLLPCPNFSIFFLFLLLFAHYYFYLKVPLQWYLSKLQYLRVIYE